MQIGQVIPLIVNLLQDIVFFWVILVSLGEPVRPEKFQFMGKGKNRNFGYKIVISVKNPKFII